MSGPSTVLIGAGPGLGIALARRFAADGRKVAIVGRREIVLKEYEAQLRGEGLDVAGFAADAGDPTSMSVTLAAIRQVQGDPGTLIYNAAIVEPARFVTRSGLDKVGYGSAPGWQARGEPADFDYFVNAFRTNVAGAHHAARELVPQMIERGGGTILLTGGILAFEPWLEWGITSAGKAALRSLGLSLAKELRPHRIHVTTIAIHGTIAEGTPYDPAAIAEAYFALEAEDPTDWQPEFHFRPAGGHTSDPDDRGAQ